MKGELVEEYTLQDRMEAIATLLRTFQKKVHRGRLSKADKEYYDKICIAYESVVREVKDGPPV